MAKSIRVIQVGVGATGRNMVRFLTERGCEVVACVDPFSKNIGNDVGEVCGIGKLGVKIEKDLESALKRTKPDIATVCTVSEVKRLAPTIKTIVENNVNIVTLAEECFYPWAVDAKLADELDTLAKQHGVTVLGTGMQDLYWQTLAGVLAGGVHHIKKIRGANRAVGDGNWGLTNADEVFAGKTVQEYETAMEEKKKSGNMDERSIFGVTLYSIAAEFGLHPQKLDCKHVPIISTYDHYIPEIDRMIPKGNICGLEESSSLETEEGILLEASFYDQYTNPGDTAMNSWEIEGEPNLRLVVDDVRGDCAPFTILTNRVADVINAKPGFLSCKDMPKFVGHPLPLPEYLKD